MFWESLQTWLPISLPRPSEDSLLILSSAPRCSRQLYQIDMLGKGELVRAILLTSDVAIRSAPNERHRRRLIMFSIARLPAKPRLL